MLDVVLFVFSEINFIQPERAIYKLDTAFGRLKARFATASAYFGMVVIDSSADATGSVVDNFIDEQIALQESEDNPDAAKIRVLIVRSKIWEVKPWEDDAGRFEVYLGDLLTQPFIVRPDTDRSKLDPDRFLSVPERYLPEFRRNISKALNEQAGISTSSQDRFITNTDNFEEVFSIPLMHPVIAEVDFYNENDDLFRIFKEAVMLIPRDRVIAIRFDLGIVHDLTGVSIGYIDSMVTVNAAEVKMAKARSLNHKSPKHVKVPFICVPVQGAIGRLPNQETSITKIYRFVKDLAQVFDIGCITLDGYQSTQIIQDLKVDGFKAYRLSVDSTPDAYFNLKNIIYENRLRCANNPLTIRELNELTYKRMNNGKFKIDHPESTSTDTYTYGKGSKDSTDGLSGMVESILRDIDIFTAYSKTYNERKHLDLIRKSVINNKENVSKSFEVSMRSGGLERLDLLQKNRDAVAREHLDAMDKFFKDLNEASKRANVKAKSYKGVRTEKEAYMDKFRNMFGE